ncbi:MAG TPA: hypothetical protein VIQ24_04960 [Pyrinomonadaceae bacterium]
MSTQLQVAQAELTADVRREINWFVPPGEKHFVNPGTIGTVAAVLLGMFFSGVLDGLKDTVKEEGKKAGKALGKKIATRLRAITSNKEEVNQAEVEQDAEAAKAKLQAANQTQATIVFDQVEAELRMALQEVMPESRAGKLATRVRHVAIKVVYETQGAS